eukprot:CFRG7276T1
MTESKDALIHTEYFSKRSGDELQLTESERTKRYGTSIAKMTNVASVSKDVPTSVDTETSRTDTNTKTNTPVSNVKIGESEGSAEGSAENRFDDLEYMSDESEEEDEDEAGCDESEIYNEDVRQANKIAFVSGFGYACILPNIENMSRLRLRTRLNYIAHTFPGDFTIPPFADVDITYLSELIHCGYLPMMHVIMGRQWLTPKIHRHRSLIMLDTGDLHISKSTKKKAKKYKLTVDTAFDQIIEGCNNYHKSCWLRKPLVAAFRKLHSPSPFRFASEVPSSTMPCDTPECIDTNTNATKLTSYTATMPTSMYTTYNNAPDTVRVRTIELWDKAGKQLVAGEVGYTIGRTYTSLSGFTGESGAGTVQCAALGRLLERCGFSYWDLGMSMEYKKNLGAKSLPRLKYLSLLAEARVASPERSVTSMEGACAKDIITS